MKTVTIVSAQQYMAHYESLNLSISIQQIWKLRERNFIIYTAIKSQRWSLNLGSLACRVTTLWSARLKLDQECTTLHFLFTPSFSLIIIILTDRHFFANVSHMYHDGTLTRYFLLLYFLIYCFLCGFSPFH